MDSSRVDKKAACFWSQSDSLQFIKLPGAGELKGQLSEGHGFLSPGQEEG